MLKNKKKFLIISPIKSTTSVLNEGAVDDKVKKYIRDNCANYFKKYIDTRFSDLPDDIADELPQIDGDLYKSCAERNTTLLDFFRLHLMKNFDIRHGKGPIEYLPGIARIACAELGMFNESADVSELARFKQLVLFVYNNPTEIPQKYDRNFNNLTYREFKSQVNDIRKEFNIKKRSSTGNVASSKKYNIVPIDSQEKASKYHEYTTWCICDNSYAAYTGSGERFYFCLADGFKDVEKKVGEGCPLDEYGLSMVSVLVDMDGEPVHITTRWNHEHDGEDNENFHTVEQFESVMGIPFYQTFKPYSKEELRKKGVIPFDEIQGMLDSGMDPHDIFQRIQKEVSGYRAVEINDKWNLIDSNNKLYSDIWYERISPIENGIVAVRHNGKYNWIDLNEKRYLSDKWFDFCYNFDEYDIAIVYNNTKRAYNFVGKNGKLLSDEWYHKMSAFREGFSIVREGTPEKFNFIDTKGNLISDTWYSGAVAFDNGLAQVENEDKMWNYIDRKGNIISDIWFEITNPFEDDVAIVALNDKLNFIRKDGTFLSDTWFKSVKPFYDGIAKITNDDNKVNVIDENGKLVLNDWYDKIDYVEPKHSRYAIVKVYDKNDRKKEMYVDLKTGNPVFGKVFDDAGIFFADDTRARVVYNNKCYIMDNEGNFISDGYDKMSTGKFGWYAVEKEPRKWNFIDKNGKLLLKDFADYVTDFKELDKEWNVNKDLGDDVKAGAIAYYDHKPMYIDQNGKVHDNMILDRFNPYDESVVERKQINRLMESIFRKKNKETFDESTNPEDLDLTSFEPKDELNPKFWSRDELDLYARRQLLIIARDFLKDLEIKDMPIEDVIITGSIANYNWNENFSDIDLHIVVNFDKIDANEDIVKKMFDAVKKTWNDTHKDVTIYSYPVEVYVQDVNEEHKSTGIYSILYDKWIVKPNKESMKPDDIDDDVIRKTAADFMDKIDDLDERLSNAETDEEYDKIYNDSIKLFKEIKDSRKSGIGSTRPELSSGNLIFKTLRRNGYIEKIIDIRNKAYSLVVSI